MALTPRTRSDAERLLREIHANYGRVYLYRSYGGWRAGLHGGTRNGYVCPKMATAADAIRYLWDWLRP